MKILVCGSREWVDEDRIRDRLAQFERATIIHGDARGADRMAGKVAEEFDWDVQPFPAEWKVTDQTRSEDIRIGPGGWKYDCFAGKRRNLAMLDNRPDMVLAFQRDGSGGTAHTIAEARKRGIPVEVHKA